MKALPKTPTTNSFLQREGKFANFPTSQQGLMAIFHKENESFKWVLFGGVAKIELNFFGHMN